MLGNKNSAQMWEDAYPSALSSAVVLVCVCGLFYNRGWITPVVAGVAKLVPAALNIGAIAVGFLATAQALLLSLGNSPALAPLRGTEHYNRLITFFTRALTASFVSSLLSALLAAIRLDHGGGWRYACVILWSFCGLTALCCYYRASKMLSIILHLNNVPAQHASHSSDQRQNDVEIIEG